MESRTSVQKDQDLDRHSHYASERKTEQKEENCTNEGRETSCGMIAKKDCDVPTNHRTDDGTRDDCDEENTADDAPSDKSSWYPYFPLNYSFPPHNLHFEPSHNRYTGFYNYYYPPEHYYHSHHYRSQYYRFRQHPFTSQLGSEYKHRTNNTMAPFDDKTAVASNVTKGNDGSMVPRVNYVETIEQDYWYCVNDMCPRLSTEYDRRHDYKYYNHSASTPKRSNQFAVGAKRASRKLVHSGDPNQVQYSPMAASRSSGFEFPEKQNKYAKPTDHSSHQKRPYFYPHYSNGWYPDNGNSAQPYHTQPYDKHYFCPSPPPPPQPPNSLGEYPPQAYSESVSHASSPPPPKSWYEGKNGKWNQRSSYAPHQAYQYWAAASYDRSSHAPHQASPNWTAASYENSDPAPEETYTAQELKDRPETPSSCHDSRRISRVTPQNKSGRQSPETVNLNFPPSSTKPIVTPGEKKKIGSSLFSPSSTVVELRDMDIVCGRGAPTKFHIGNQEFRELASRYHMEYFCAKRSDKPKIAMAIMDELQSRGARFVRRQKGGSVTKALLEKNKQGSSTLSSHWVEVSAKIAYEKVCEALRDGTENIQHQMLSSSRPPLGKSKSASSKMKNQKSRRGNSNIPQLHSGEVNKDSIRTTTEQGKENGDRVHRI